MIIKGKKYPKISVITPSYNQAQFLEETINSVLSQEGDFYIDYIIADGGSMDNSVEIIKKYDELIKTKKYHIKCRGIEYCWWSRKDGGQSDAINKGIDLARGGIVNWLNSDDVYFSVYSIANVVKAFQKDKSINVLFGDLAYIDKEGRILGFYAFQRFDYEKLLYYGYNLGQPAVFLKTDVLKQNKIKKGLHYVMDYELWLRLGEKYNFKHVSEVLAGFRLYSESKSGSRHNDSLTMEKKNVLESYDHYDNKKVTIKLFEKILRGGTARLKGFIYLIKYRYFLKKSLSFQGKYLQFPYDIIRQLLSRVKS